MVHSRGEIVLEIDRYESVYIDFGLGTILSVLGVRYAQLAEFACSVTIKSTQLVWTALLTIRVTEVLARYHLISKRFANHVIRRSTMRTTTGYSKTYDGWMTI